MTRAFLLFGLFIACEHGHAQEVVISQNRPAPCGNATGALSCFAWGGVEPYTFSWSPAPGTGQGTPNAGGLAPGYYEVTVTDALNTMVTAGATVVAVPTLLWESGPLGTQYACGPECTGPKLWSGQALGGSPPYSFTFDPPGPVGSYTANGSLISGLCAGNDYTLTITDATGCASVMTTGPIIHEPFPQLINEVMLPSCELGANGSIELYFDQPVNLMHSWTYTGSPYGVSAYHLLSDLAPGYMPIMLSRGGSANCSDTLLLWRTVPETQVGCGSVSGSVYVDMDNDCIRDAAEPGLPFATVQVMPGDIVFLTDAQGLYERQIPYGDYTLEVLASGYAQPCNPAISSIDLSEGSPTASVDVVLDPLFGPDASVFIAGGALRPGFATNHWIRVENNGPYTISDLTATFTHHPARSLVSSSVIPSSNGLATLAWDLPVLGPFEHWQVEVSMELAPDPLLIGNMAEHTVAISGPFPDEDPLNDQYSIEDIIVGAYDPNDKTALTSSRSMEGEYRLDEDEYVDYTIRFQNTGNAEAINVYLLDTVTVDLDLTSLRVLGASHPFAVQWVDDRVLRFDFPLIMLPDSTSDPMGSQGFASFRIRPIEGLIPGDVIRNAADIFFDFSPPIRTNTTVLQLSVYNGISDHALEPGRSWPNPVADVLFLEMGEVDSAVLRVLDTQGRDVLHGRWQRGQPIAMGALVPGVYTVLLPEYGAVFRVVRE